MPQSPKTIGFAQTTPTVKSEMEAKCLSAASTPNNNTIFSFPSIPSQEDMSSKANNIQYNSPAAIAFRHQEGKQLDVNDVNVNVNVVASCASSSASSHVTVSTSSNTLSSSESSSTNNTDSQSSKLNVINICDGSDKSNVKNDVITDAHIDPTNSAGFYDSMKMEGNNGETTTAIIYETIVIENPPMAAPKNQQEIISFVTAGSSNNNNKLIANKNMSLESVGNGGILVLTGSLNDLLNSHVISNCLSSQSSSGAGTNISKCLNLNEKKSNTNHIQSIVLNLNSQSSSAPTSGQIISTGGQKSIRLAINPNQQVRLAFVGVNLDMT